MPERKTRSDKGTYKLTARDVQVLTWIGHMYTVRFDILKRLLSRQIDWGQKLRAYAIFRQQGKDIEIPDTNLLADSSVYLVLGRWKNAGLVQTAQIVGGESIYIWLTQKGIDSVGLPYRFVVPSLGLIKHMHAVTKVRLRLEELHPLGTWTSERELIRSINKFDEQQRQRIDHVPDGELDLEDGKKLVIEVELSKKSEKRLFSILRNLKQRYSVERGDSTIYYFATDETAPPVEKIAYTSQDKGKPLLDESQLEILFLRGGYS